MNEIIHKKSPNLNSINSNNSHLNYENNNKLDNTIFLDKNYFCKNPINNNSALQLEETNKKKVDINNVKNNLVKKEELEISDLVSELSYKSILSPHRNLLNSEKFVD